MSASCEPGRAPLEGGSEMGAGATEDMDGQGQGSSGSESRSGHSLHSSNGQDSALLESSESNKSTNSHSPSPPSSSVAYSLLSTGSEQDNPSTSGCSSEQSARVKTQKELMKALKEMKIRLPSEKRGKGQSGTLATLQYALSCVKQVQASHDYYQQWTVDGSRPRDAASYTVGELQSITSEYTCKNPDTFAVAVSYVTGKILYVSEQAAPLLRCKRDDFKGAAFADFLAPQDVSVFYGSTAPDHLPSWGACTSPTAAAIDYTPEKSLFCRIRRLFLSGGRTRGRELCYSPFRLTPYLAQVRPTDTAEGHPCCLLIAERIHSGYEAPRIPPDKRIFITRHTPSCLFQDVDERATPLLGYLPQDLIGKPVLFYLHPEDRPLMLAIHKKILQYGGQPFDHSPLRFCARNGEYVTIDTSWSSFVNPWSRKVSFVMGRHKVRTGPLNEDVFTAPKTLRTLEPNIQEISEQVHRLLLQPVHSSASHEQFLSAASSSSSNGLPTEEGPAQRPMTFQQFCKDVHMVKNRGQQAFIESRTKPPAAAVPPAGREVPKHSCGSGRGTPCEPEPGPDRGAASEESLRKESSSYSYQQINCLDGIIRYLESYNIPSRVKRKCGSSSYTSSSNSDDGRQKADEEAAGSAKDAAEEMCPESEERPGPPSGPVAGPPLAPLAVSGQAESVVSGTSQCSFTSTIVHVGDKKPLDSEVALTEEPPGPERYRRLGLTLEVLSAHTQRAEQLFLSRFKDLSQLHVFGAAAEGRRPAEPGHRLPRRSKCKAKRVKQHRTSESPGQPASWPAAGPCQASPAFPAYSLPGFLPGQPPAPLVAPVVALMLPNYIFPPPCFPAPASFGEPPGSPQPPSSPQPPGSPLFDSRCSSPLQLNLLQMDEAPPGPAERQEAPGAQAGTGERGPQEETGLVEGQDSNNDALSSSSDLLELLLQEDSHSGTGSAASGSGSLGSSSHPGSTSASGTPSSKSSRTSKYFGSVEWSEPERAGPDPGAGAQLVKYVLQDPVWLLMAKSDETLMMTYQLPARSAAAVLREDREKLRQMQKQQPRFTEGQRKELAAVHPWVMDGRLPKAIDVTACLGCSCPPAPGPPSPYAGEVPEGDLSATLEPMDESPAAGPEAAMDHEEAGQLARPEMGAENIA